MFTCSYCGTIPDIIYVPDLMELDADMGKFTQKDYKQSKEILNGYGGMCGNCYHDDEPVDAE